MAKENELNIDNVVPNDEDIEWATLFIYPDLRPAYKLEPNKEKYTDPIMMVAKARAAILNKIPII